MKKNSGYPEHVKNFFDNLKEVVELINIHEQIAGNKKGRKSRVETLNKSGIVLLTACWETYVEELISNAFDFLISNATNYNSIPYSILTRASADLKNDKDERKVWKLAGEGWKDILNIYKQKILADRVDYFHTPRPDNIDRLFEELIGIKKITACWRWKKMNNAKVVDILNQFIDLRGSIAHKVKSSKRVLKKDVTYYYRFINCIGVLLHNKTDDHLIELTGKSPWGSYMYLTIG